MLGASGSNRPSFWDLFQARTLSVRVSYSAVGMTYFSTADRSEKSVRAAGGRVSTTYDWVSVQNHFDVRRFVEGILRDIWGVARQPQREWGSLSLSDSLGRKSNAKHSFVFSVELTPQAGCAQIESHAFGKLVEQQLQVHARAQD